MSEGQAPAQRGGAGQAPDPLIGRVIAGRFRITSLIARGGMGKVYRAEQSPLGRVCAIKVLNPNYDGDADPEFHRRFFREASVASRIMHPNSVTIFDYGRTDDDIYFMAMEYLEGKTLHMAMREGGPMGELRGGRIAAQICRALREAHKLGVIHRDLKPANVFLTRPSTRAPDVNGTTPPPSEEDEDFVKVLDFGLVKHMSERPEEQLTQTGLFMGSPKYMAPEQIQGGHVDERTDIYSLGIIMYEMIAGRVPFERATSVNILMAHVGEPPPRMYEVNPKVTCSPAFEEIIMTCIAKDPNERFGSMDQVLAAIRRAHGGSMTGQIAALSTSGHYAASATGTAPHRAQPQSAAMRSYPPSAAMRSYPPPAMVTGPVRPMMHSAPSAMAAGAMASASHTAMGMIRADAQTSAGYAEAEEPPRSKLLIVVGVLVAAVIGGGLGMLAFKLTWTAPEHLPAPPASTPTANQSAVAPSAVPSVATSAASTLAEAHSPPLHVTTEPSGASIRDESKEVCASTPCDVVFKLDPDPSKTHKLVISHAGFRSETRTVRPGDPPLHVKLTHPKPSPSQSPSPSPAPPSIPTGRNE
jgi:serine/threonine-protein kinase